MLMKKHLFTFIFLLFLTGTSHLCAQTYRQWEFVNPADLQITITPEKNEIIAGSVATFTITIRNRTDKTVHIYYPTGQQWDLATYHNRTQIFRWSQGMTWRDAPHSIPLKSGETRSEKLSWETTDRLGFPLPQGIYTAQGMVMTKPRYLVSNDCKIRLLPPEVKKMEVIDAKLNQLFEVEVPRFSGNRELTWKIDYVYNDNRISVHSIKKLDKTMTILFHPKRVGYVEFHLYGYKDVQNETLSLERRSFRIEVK